MVTRERVYGDGHHFTECARKNLDYVRNKRRATGTVRTSRE